MISVMDSLLLSAKWMIQMCLNAGRFRSSTRNSAFTQRCEDDTDELLWFIQVEERRSGPGDEVGTDEGKGEALLLRMMKSTSPETQQFVVAMPLQELK